MLRTELTKWTVLSRNPALPSAALGQGNFAVLNLSHDHYYGLDHVAARIWELIEAPISIASLEEALKGEYQVSDTELTDDLLPFVSKLLDEGLAIVHPA